MGRSEIPVCHSCRCCDAVELFAAACIRLGIPQPAQYVDPYTGQLVADPNADPYLPAVPEPLRQHLSAMLPGLHAMSHANFASVSTMVDLSALQHNMVKAFLGLPVAKAVLKVHCWLVFLLCALPCCGVLLCDVLC